MDFFEKADQFETLSINAMIALKGGNDIMGPGDMTDEESAEDDHDLFSD